MKDTPAHLQALKEIERSAIPGLLEVLPTPKPSVRSAGRSTRGSSEENFPDLQSQDDEYVHPWRYSEDDEARPY